MDRSFLSDERVVAASRQFVCIRLATYEDREEAEFMKSLYLGRSGHLENTTFAILSPNADRKLIAAGRGPFFAYRDAAAMAHGMTRIASQYRSSRSAEASLPLIKNVDLALNVAAAEGLPLIVTVAEEGHQLAAANKRLSPVAWSEPLVGQFVYASVLDGQDLKPITGATHEAGVLVVKPGQFGLSGEVLARFGEDFDARELQRELRQIATRFPRESKDHSSHVRLGIQLGIDWESQIPETDPRSIRARQRARGN